ncbi:MAG: cyclic nucleotide-binding domain-containing protein [Bacteroidota bacterium]
MKLLENRRYSKNEVIYAKGKIPDRLSYLDTGNAIALSHSKPNRQVLRFWVTHQLICPYGVFHNLPLNHSIIALDDCIVSSLNYQKIQLFLTEHPEGYKIINRMLANEINSVQLHIKSFLQNKSILQHEAFLAALSISFDE